ncbi:hypothetical protein Tco_1355406 [Tanacetum coccineum]
MTMCRKSSISFLLNPIEGYQPSNDEIGSIKNLESDFDKNPTLFAASVTTEEEHILKLKELPPHLEYAFLVGKPEFLVIISLLLSRHEKVLLLDVLTKHKTTLAWKDEDIKGIILSFYTHKILVENNYKLVLTQRCKTW